MGESRVNVLPGGSGGRWCLSAWAIWVAQNQRALFWCTVSFDHMRICHCVLASEDQGPALALWDDPIPLGGLSSGAPWGIWSTPQCGGRNSGLESPRRWEMGTRSFAGSGPGSGCLPCRYCQLWPVCSLAKNRNHWVLGSGQACLCAGLKEMSATVFLWECALSVSVRTNNKFLICSVYYAVVAHYICWMNEC